VENLWQGSHTAEISPLHAKRKSPAATEQINEIQVIS